MRTSTSRAVQRIRRQVGIPFTQRLGYLLKDYGELAEYRARRPLYLLLRVGWEQVVDGEGDPAAYEGVEQAVGVEAFLRRGQYDYQDGGDRSLVYQQVPLAEHDDSGHGQSDHYPDLHRADAYEEDYEVGYEKAHGHTESDLERSPPALAQRDAQSDHRRYRGEEGLAAAEDKDGQEVGEAGSDRSLQDGPEVSPQTLGADKRTPA